MAKILKIVSRLIGMLIEWIIVLVILFAFAIRSSQFQTFLGSIATDYLSEELDTEMRIGKIDIQFLDKLLLKDVFVKDQYGDTLASLDLIQVTVESINLSGNAITLSNVQLHDGRVGISRDSITGDYNYFFITDYFDSGKKSTKKKEPIALTIKSLDIESVDISYDDNRKGYSEYGMDYDHLFFDEVEMHAKQFKVGDGTFAFYLQHLSTTEKCGFRLRRLISNCFIDQDRGIFLTGVKIQTPTTTIYSHKFNMKMSDLQGLQEFEDSVTFDAVIDSSHVDLRDVAYFATALEGMSDRIAVSGELHRKVKNLAINDVDLRFGSRSVVRGDFYLPDFRKIKGSAFQESVSYALVDLDDLTRLKLPKDMGSGKIILDPMIARLGYVEIKRSDIRGTTDRFVVQSKVMTSALGSVSVNNGVTFNALEKGGYAFKRTMNSKYDVYVDSFQLGKFIDNSLFGKVTGAVFLSGVVGQKDVIRIEELSGDIQSLQFNEYAYTNIDVANGSLRNNVFAAKIDIDDPHLKLSYNGTIDLRKDHHYVFDVDIPQADLGKLNWTKDPNSKLSTTLTMDMHGSGLSTYAGKIDIEQLNYQEKNKTIEVPSLVFDVKRLPQTDIFTIKSNVADIELVGKINPNTIQGSLQNCMAQLLPAYFEYREFSKKKPVQDHFELKVDVKEAADFLAIFLPDVSIAKGTELVGAFDGRTGDQSLDIQSSELAYTEVDQEDTTNTFKKYLTDFSLVQTKKNHQVTCQINASHAQWNDSIYVEEFDCEITGDSASLRTRLGWNDKYPNPAEINFLTQFKRDSSIRMLIKPSFFTIKKQMWEIMNTAELVYASDRVLIDHLVVERDVQFLAINGVLSNDPKDVISIFANDLHIEEFIPLVDPELDMAGRLNGTVRLSTPFTNIGIDGDLSAKRVYINKQEIGDINLGGNWNDEIDGFFLQGNLNYLHQKTFDFGGHFYPYRDEENLDFRLNFREMDIQFLNAFMDPDVLSDIKGLVKGELTVKGRTENPNINGRLSLQNGNVKVGLLGVNYKVTKGPIRFDGDNSGIYAELPVKDEEGNDAYIFAQAFHTNFENWNMDLDFVFDERVRKFGAPQNRLLVLNTKYKPGDVYYGKAYATGSANINIQENLTSITVTARTERGTKVDLPMYGSGELSEFDFISFDQDTLKNSTSKVNLTGIDLNMNIIPTTDAEVRLIFNEKTEDLMIANGQGDLNITADNFGNIFMSGQYMINSGKYNFVFNPIREEFFLKNGGTITWTGNPYDANLNISAYTPVNASLDQLTGGVVGGTTSDNNSIVHCILNVTNTLNDPYIGLDIDAPNATEAGKSALNRAKSSKDDLQRQFFSLLVMKKFIPINGGLGVGTGGIGDLVSEQLNAILDKMSSDVKFRVGYSEMTSVNQGSMTVGMQSALGEKQNIIVKGTFGVANTQGAQANTTSSSLIGDMSIEYLINEEGTFRATVANESNKKGVLTESDRGEFSQVVGVYYQEEFNKTSDSKIVNFITDPFNRKKKRPGKKGKKVPLPQDQPVTLPNPPIIDPNGPAKTESN